MLRTENGKLVIEMETGDAAFETYTLMHDIVYAVGAIDKELVSNGTDCISLLEAMLPSEEGYENYIRSAGQEVKRKGRKK